MSNGNRRYTYRQTFDARSPNGRYEICFMGDKGYHGHNDPVVWSYDCTPDDDLIDDGQPPLALRQEYERLLKADGWIPELADHAVDIAKCIIASQTDDVAYDQPCAYGCRVEYHAVYCENDKWLYAPRKCRRTQGPSVWSNQAWPHEKCAGFLANPLYKGGHE